MSVTEQNVENYAVFCHQKDNGTCKQGLIRLVVEVDRLFRPYGDRQFLHCRLHR